MNVENRDYLYNLDLKDAYFSVHLKKKLKEIGSLVRKFVRVPLFLLWFRTDTRNINKIVKSGNDNLTQDKDQNQYLLRRQAINWSVFRSDTYEPRHSNLPSAISRIWINWKECVFTPVKEIFEPGNQLCHSRTFFKQHKNAKSSSKRQNLLNNPRTSILELTKLIDLLTSTIQAVLPARLNYRFLQMPKISSLTENFSYLDKIVLNKNSKIELKWWVQN